MKTIYSRNWLMLLLALATLVAGSASGGTYYLLSQLDRPAPIPPLPYNPRTGAPVHQVTSEHGGIWLVDDVGTVNRFDLSQKLQKLWSTVEQQKLAYAIAQAKEKAQKKIEPTEKETAALARSEYPPEWWNEPEPPLPDAWPSPTAGPDPYAITIEMTTFLCSGGHKNLTGPGSNQRFAPQDVSIVVNRYENGVYSFVTNLTDFVLPWGYGGSKLLVHEPNTKADFYEVVVKYKLADLCSFHQPWDTPEAYYLEVSRSNHNSGFDYFQGYVAHPGQWDGYTRFATTNRFYAYVNTWLSPDCELPVHTNLLAGLPRSAASQIVTKLSPSSPATAQHPDKLEFLSQPFTRYAVWFTEYLDAGPEAWAEVDEIETDAVGYGVGVFADMTNSAAAQGFLKLVHRP